MRSADDFPLGHMSAKSKVLQKILKQPNCQLRQSSAKYYCLKYAHTSIHGLSGLPKCHKSATSLVSLGIFAKTQIQVTPCRTRFWPNNVIYSALTVWLNTCFALCAPNPTFYWEISQFHPYPPLLGISTQFCCIFVQKMGSIQLKHWHSGLLTKLSHIAKLFIFLL